MARVTRLGGEHLWNSNFTCQRTRVIPKRNGQDILSIELALAAKSGKNGRVRSALQLSPSRKMQAESSQLQRGERQQMVMRLFDERRCLHSSSWSKVAQGGQATLKVQSGIVWLCREVLQEVANQSLVMADLLVEVAEWEGWEGGCFLFQLIFLVLFCFCHVFCFDFIFCFWDLIFA